jgi:hypothetical protein
MSMAAAAFGEPFGESWQQFAQLGLAVVLSAAVGLERELRQKSAELRTYTTVGLGAALFMLVSKFAFSDIAHAGLVVRGCCATCWSCAPTPASPCCTSAPWPTARTATEGGGSKSVLTPTGVGTPTDWHWNCPRFPAY